MRTYDEYKSLAENAMIPMIESIGAIPEPLMNAMKYSLQAGGKRIRPVMLLAACDMAGGSMESALPFACALEMIHTYSLIHDDLPAMDNDDMRRGMPTNHKVFGDGMATLAGDGLLNGAAEIMLNTIIQFSPPNGNEAASVIMKHAGVTGMIAGQAIDLDSEGKPPEEETVCYIHLHKTADLLQAPLEAGLLLGRAKKEQIEIGKEYGYHLGMAFQISDDILDIAGNSQLLGKNTGSDMENGKMTWVSLKGMDRSKDDVRRHIDDAISVINGIGLNTRFFTDLAESIYNRISII